MWRQGWSLLQTQANQNRRDRAAERLHAAQPALAPSRSQISPAAHFRDLPKCFIVSRTASHSSPSASSRALVSRMWLTRYFAVATQLPWRGTWNPSSSLTCAIHDLQSHLQPLSKAKVHGTGGSACDDVLDLMFCSIWRDHDSGAGACCSRCGWVRQHST